MAEQFSVEVCYASAERQFLCGVQVAPGSTIQQAIVFSGVLQAVPELELATLTVGIFAKKKTLDTVLRARDRVEIYRPLIADPKHARRRRKALTAAVSQES